MEFVGGNTAELLGQGGALRGVLKDHDREAGASVGAHALQGHGEAGPRASIGRRR
ncbi:MAG: hypothetical protein R3F62_04765 [Planctomycetota bacterium]